MGANDDGEKILKKSETGWNAALSKDVKGSLILTNKRLMIEDSSNSYFLKDIINIDFLPLNRIQITLRDKTIKLLFAKRSISHGIDQFASVIFETPFEAGSWQEEVASYTAHWASVLTTALLLYGEPPTYEDQKAWCGHCKKYVDVEWTDTPVWKLVCPECNQKGMTTLSPKDRLKDKGNVDM